MLNKKTTGKVIKYSAFALNSLLASVAFTLFQKFYFLNDNSNNGFFTIQRIILFLGIALCCFLIFFICSMGEKRYKFELYIEKLGTHPLTTVVLFSEIFRVCYSSFFNKFTVYYDTKTYTGYPFNIFKGETDIFRTPGYPYFLKLIHFLTGNAELDSAFYIWVVVFQSILSLSSVILIYLAGRKLFKNKYVLSAAALFYGISPSVFSWDACILTESLSLFSVSLLIFIVFSYLAKPNLFKAIVLGLYSFVMVMIRPTFIYVLAILAVFFIARFIFTRVDRRNCIAGFLSVVVSIGLVLGYCGLNYNNYGYFAVSSVNNTVNNLYIVMVNGWTDNDEYPEIKEHIETEMAYTDVGYWIPTIIERLPETFSYSEIDSYVSGCINKHKSEYLKYTVDKFKARMNQSVASQYTVINDNADEELKNMNSTLRNAVYTLCNSVSTDRNIDFVSYSSEQPIFRSISKGIINFTFPFTFLGCFILVAIGILFALIILIVKKRICWQVIGLCAIIFSHIFVSVFGAQAEWARLSTMVIPAVILLVFFFLDYIINCIKKHRVFCVDNSNSTAIKIKNKQKSDKEGA